MSVVAPQPSAEVLPGMVRDADLCVLFGVSQQTVRARVRRGEIPKSTVVMGRSRYWDRDTIERFLRGESGGEE